MTTPFKTDTTSTRTVLVISSGYHLYREYLLRLISNAGPRRGRGRLRRDPADRAPLAPRGTLEQVPLTAPVQESVDQLSLAAP